MALSPLTALSPLDGRYRDKVSGLAPYASEFALIRTRIRVEIEWLKALAAEPALPEIRSFSKQALRRLDALTADFSEADAEAVKAIELRTNHDVKALEYWLKERLADTPEIVRAAEFIHFACTSEDINNLCHALMARDSRAQILLPALDRVTAKLTALAHAWAALPMLSRTHGQAATPTTLGKEMANFVHRLRRVRGRIAEVVLGAKMNGAVGNYNAHLVAYPDFDWEAFARRFVESLALSFNPR